MIDQVESMHQWSEFKVTCDYCSREWIVTALTHDMSDLIGILERARWTIRQEGEHGKDECARCAREVIA